MLDSYYGIWVPNLPWITKFSSILVNTTYFYFVLFKIEKRKLERYSLRLCSTHVSGQNFGYYPEPSLISIIMRRINVVYTQKYGAIYDMLYVLFFAFLRAVVWPLQMSRPYEQQEFWSKVTLSVIGKVDKY